MTVCYLNYYCKFLPTVLAGVTSAQQLKRRHLSSDSGKQKKKRRRHGSDDELRSLASSKLNRRQQQQLYDTAERRFPTPTTLSMSAIQDWLPCITDEKAWAILLHRNQQAANEMVANEMVRRKQASAESRQKKLMDSFTKKV